MDELILSTKLHIPQTRENLVLRSQPTTKLGIGITHSEKIALVSAPAGYGKTTLVAKWVENIEGDCAWLSLDSSNNDPKRFYAYLAAALQNVDENIGLAVNDSLESSQEICPETIATALINGIDSLSIPCALILDNYHLITSKLIHQTIEFIVDNSPPLLYTVIITRQNPPFPLSKWRARNQIIEIGIEDLKFNIEETEKFFEKTMELQLSSPQILSINNKTEGWITGLQLTALSLKDQERDSVGKKIKNFTGSQTLFVDYFFENVVQTQSTEIQNFLRKTSIADEITASLCNELTGRTDSQSVILQLIEDNLFIESLDLENKWFRYHQLFKSHLQAQLDPNEAIRLHKIAANWMSKHGQYTKAIDHALSGKDKESASRLISEQLITKITNYELDKVINWLDEFPDAVVSGNSLFCTYKACAHYMNSDIDKAKYYANAYKSSHELDDLNTGRIKAVKSMVADDQMDTIELASDALKLLGDQDQCAEVISLTSLAHAQRNIGDLDQSTSTLNKALLICSKAGYKMPVYSIYLDLAFNYYIHGQLQQAIQFCNTIINVENLVKNDYSPAINLMYIPLGIFNLEVNDLKSAEQCIGKGLEAAYHMGIQKILGGDAEMALARIRFLQGKSGEAISILHQCIYEELKAGLKTATLRLSATLAEIQLKLGNIVWAEDWVKESNLSLDGEISSAMDLPYLVYARLLVAKERWQDAQFLLDKMEKIARKSKRGGRLVTILILKSLIFNEQGSIHKAKNVLTKAINIAARQNYLRPFLDDGKKLINLFPMIEDKEPDFVGKLITECEKEFSKNGVITGQNKSVDSNLINLDSQIFESLSERELEVLSLVSRGLSNNQISEKLFISLGTVKWYLNQIFNKLEVRNRMQAVIRARELKII